MRNPEQIFVPAAGEIAGKLKMNSALAARIESALTANRQLGQHAFEYRGSRFTVSDGVFSPVIFEDSLLFTDRLAEDDIKLENMSMLDVGCGCGVTGLWLLKNRHLRSLVASDISPAPVKCTTANSQNLKISDKVRTIQSDIFDSIPTGEKFDVIHWSHPWEVQPADYHYPDELSRSIFDRGYEGLEKYMRGIGDRLQPEGRAFLGFGESGDEVAMKAISRTYGYEPVAIKTFAGEKNFGIKFSLYELRR